MAIALGGGQVLLGPIGSLLVDRALAIAQVDGRRNGLRPPATFTALQAILERAAAEARSTAGGSAELPHAADPASSTTSPPSSVMVDPVGTATAAKLLGCSARNIRDLASRGVFETATVRGGCWWVERQEIEARLLSRAS